MAAGLSIRRIHYQRFAAAFADEVERRVSEDEVRGVVMSDGQLSAPEIQLDTANRIADAGPWGQAFPEPVFHGDFEVVHQRVVGENHTRLTLRLDGRVLDAIAFNQLPLAAAKRVRVAYQLDRNDYRDQITLQLRVVHIEALQS